MRNNALTAIIAVFATLFFFSGCKPPINPVTENTSLDFCVYDPGCSEKMALGHRGTGAYNIWAVENSIAAYDYAWKMGADSIEIDVRKTKDGVLVIMHDSTVNRTTNGTGNIEEKTLAEVKALKMLSLNPEAGVQQVPTFMETLEFLKGKTLIDIDMKTGDIAAIVNEVTDAGMENSAYLGGISSVAQADLARSINPDIAIMPKIASLAEAADFIDNASPVAFFEIEYENATPELVDYIHSKGIKIHINSLTTYDLLGKLGFQIVLDRGTDIIQTDRLEVLVPFLNNI